METRWVEKRYCRRIGHRSYQNQGCSQQSRLWPQACRKRIPCPQNRLVKGTWCKHCCPYCHTNCIIKRLLSIREHLRWLPLRYWTRQGNSWGRYRSWSSCWRIHKQKRQKTNRTSWRLWDRCRCTSLGIWDTRKQKLYEEEKILNWLRYNLRTNRPTLVSHEEANTPSNCQ